MEDKVREIFKDIIGQVSKRTNDNYKKLLQLTNKIERQHENMKDYQMGSQIL
jgi:hypothetical protein